MKVSVIIVSYNTLELTKACLASLRRAGGEKEILVVDNASTDGSPKMIRDQFPEVILIENEKNLGFGRANNVALARARGEYVIFLNPDTVVKSEAIEKAVTFMEHHPEVGIAGGRILNPDGSEQESISYRYPGEKYASGETKGLSGHIACVLGAFMIARKKILDEIKGFDEDFFLYGEDEDLCWRIREQGYEVGFIPEAEVYHWGGGSESASSRPEVAVKKTLAEYLFYKKHYRPETLRRIYRRERWKARWRLITLGLSALALGKSPRHQEKVARYRLVLEMTKNPQE
ncbi:MAG TPA: glycosyltransferase family 2 protein [Syntrophales bacterium]|nr:glycosyltransferase family 2 protein [Syntrophales bacterium]HOL59351.1 glycosyltransferase family 2 protein [Syntrophales bacterium]HPO35457.1 glycosyltransferase family 2 protein [Syntrophales bacterium]